MKIKPLFERVVLESIKEENKSSTIILPDANLEKSQIAIVKEIGTGGNIDGEKIVFQVDIGDKVIYNKFSGHEISIDGKTYIIISQNDILGIIKEK
ncbi:MAG: co-chaperone GroES [Clostridia bacterium]|nr:co-chaperone GroES [Clostridia bacterium]